MEKQQPILIGFELRLTDNLRDHERPHGPLFHRWLPNGLANSIDVTIGSKGSVLQIYFERCGCVERGFVEFKLTKLKEGQELIPQQACLDGGPLFGKLLFYDYSKEEYSAIVNNKAGDPDYINLAKKII